MTSGGVAVEAKVTAKKDGDSPVTTLMFLNVPRKYTSRALAPELESYLDADSFDFVYLPWDIQADSNMGYAFVNFVDADAAATAWAKMDGKMWRLMQSARSIRITNAHVQGFSKNLLNCAYKIPLDAEAEHCPLVFKGGKSVDFRTAVKAAVRDKVGKQKAEQLKKQVKPKQPHVPAPSSKERMALRDDLQTLQAMTQKSARSPKFMDMGLEVQWESNLASDVGVPSQEPTVDVSSSGMLAHDCCPFPPGLTQAFPRLPLDQNAEDDSMLSKAISWKQQHQLDDACFGSGTSLSRASTRCEETSRTVSVTAELSDSSSSLGHNDGLQRTPSDVWSDSFSSPIITDPVAVQEVMTTEAYKRAAADVKGKLALLFKSALPRVDLTDRPLCE